MKLLLFNFHARFTLLLATTAGAWIAFVGATYAQTNSAPAIAAPGNAQTATPSATQATDISKIRLEPSHAD